MFFQRLYQLGKVSMFLLHKGNVRPANSGFQRALANSAGAQCALLHGYDSLQVKYMQEECILVNDQDQAIGSATKKDCHRMTNIGEGMLHRAFSVFLFNSQKELLLQQRSDSKITFPGLYTNTCCSHPLSSNKLETDEVKAMGVKRAAQRKLNHELGISPEQVPLDKFHYITRIRYCAENIPNDYIFGENEIDYVLFVKSDVVLRPNLNEVRNVMFVNQEALKELIEKAKNEEVILTPWFSMISDQFLFKWWDHLDEMKKVEDHKMIHVLN